MAETKKSNAKLAPARTQSHSPKVRYKGQHEIVHHLYRLNVAKMIKDHGWDENDPKYVPFEHTHVYHSVDSRGRPQNTCTPIGGHFHEVTMTEGINNEPPQLSVGPALRKIGRRVGKRIVKSSAPVPHDNHTHTASYLVSEVLVPRKMNAEFAKMQHAVTQRHAGNVPLEQKAVDQVKPAE